MTSWEVHGRELANCNCAYGCPCQFNALPTYGTCEAAAGFEIERTVDVTQGLIDVADNWVTAREQRADALRQIEGDVRFEQDQAFHRLAVKMARERRLLRIGYLARNV